MDQLTDILDWDLIVGRLAEAEPDFHPGTANGYHAVTFGWLVHRMSGMTFSEFVQKRIVEPLRLDGLYIGEADGEVDRLADLVGLPAMRRRPGLGRAQAAQPAVSLTFSGSGLDRAWVDERRETSQDFVEVKLDRGSRGHRIAKRQDTFWHGEHVEG